MRFRNQLYASDKERDKSNLTLTFEAYINKQKEVKRRGHSGQRHHEFTFRHEVFSLMGPVTYSL